MLRKISPKKVQHPERDRSHCRGSLREPKLDRGAIHYNDRSDVAESCVAQKDNATFWTGPRLRQECRKPQAEISRKALALRFTHISVGLAQRDDD